MQKISSFDLKKQYRSIQTEINQAIQDVLMKGQFSQDLHVEIFEQDFAKYIGTNYAVCVNSGTSALHLAMVVLGVGRGDEVILPTNTFIATAWAISYVGATPVFVDCQKDTWQIDPMKIEEKITKKTKAIIGVHLFGQPFDIDAIKKITRKYRLFLVEDCAQAHGALYKEKKVGNLGEIGCFSFYPTKNLGAYGEAGAITTNNSIYVKKLRILRNQGSIKKYYHEEIGFNMRMEAIQGAVLETKLKYLDKWNKRRRAIAKTYFAGIINPKIRIQYQPTWAESVFHQFVITAINRNKFMKYLKSQGINTAVHYPVPCHLQKAYKFLGYHKGDLPVAESFAKHCVSLPIYPELTDNELVKIIDAVNNY